MQISSQEVNDCLIKDSIALPKYFSPLKMGIITEIRGAFFIL
jgi:hypothetical protein